MSDEGYWLVLSEDEEGRFRAVDKPPRWAFLQTAVAAKKGDEEDQMVALYELTQALLLPSERARFDRYMGDNDEFFDKLQDSISKLCEEYVERPLAASSNSSSSSEPTAPTSRVVSLSRGVVEVTSPEAETPSSTASA